MSDTGFDRGAYLENNPTHKVYDIGGIPYKVRHDGVFTMLSILARNGMEDLTETALNKVLMTKGKQVFRQFALELLEFPPVFRTTEEADSKGGLTADEVNTEHLNVLIAKLFAEWQGAGAAEADAFRSEQDGSTATPGSSSVPQGPARVPEQAPEHTG